MDTYKYWEINKLTYKKITKYINESKNYENQQPRRALL